MGDAGHDGEGYQGAVKMKTLVEMMAEASTLKSYTDGVMDTLSAEQMLAVVKDNICMAAELCDCTRYALATGIDKSAGCPCGGSGVRAK